MGKLPLASLAIHTSSPDSESTMILTALALQLGHTILESNKIESCFNIFTHYDIYYLGNIFVYTIFMKKQLL